MFNSSKKMCMVGRPRSVGAAYLPIIEQLHIFELYHALIELDAFYEREENTSCGG